jgi:hypothetical protein
MDGYGQMLMGANTSEMMDQKGSWLHRGAVYLALTTIAIAQPLLQLYGTNVAVFAAAGYEGSIVLWFAALVIAVPTIAMLALDVSASLLMPRWRHGIHLVLVFVALWAFVSVVARAVSFGPWIADAVFTAAVAIGLTIAYQRLNTMRTWLTYMSPIALVISVAFATSASAVIWPPDVGVVDISAASRAALDELRTVPQEDVSVLWIVLDEAPLFPLLNTDGAINANRFPGFASLAKSSTWYRNVVATSQTTTDAVPAMLTGKWPTSGVGPVLSNHKNNLFTLMNGHLAMDGHEVATALCPRKVCSKVSVSGSKEIAEANSNAVTTTLVEDSESSSGRRTALGTFLRDAMVVVGHKMLPAELRTKLPPIDEGWGGFGAVDNMEEENTTQDTVPRTLTTENLEQANSTSVRQWQQGGPMSQLPVVEGVIKRATQADRPTLHFAHVLLPHRPWMLTPDMRYSRALPTDKRSNEILDRVRDEYQAHLLQYAAVDTVIGDMVTDLKKSENWDRTMIIVTADHGITFVPGESKRKTVNAANVGTLEDLYRVPLFIKYPGQQAAAQDDCTASSVDILATVVAATGIDAGWKTDGADLLRSCPQRESRSVIWADGSAEMSTGFSAAIARAKYYDSWVDANGDVADITRGGISGDLVGTRMIANASSETQVRWSIDRPDDLQRIGMGRLSFAPAQIQGRLTASRNFSTDEEGLLVIDGVVVGLISELSGLQSGESTSFRTTLLSSALLSGKHTVEMWVVSGRGAQRTSAKVSGG